MVTARPTLKTHRGATGNPPNRFERITLERDADWNTEEDPLPRTQFYRDRSDTIITRNDSPDVGFEFTVNPYRGCEHGCIYCYARPFHEYLGFSAGLDFETRIMVKQDAPHLLRQELSSARWKPAPIGMSGVTDCYQPVERKLRLTRGCLEVLAEFGNPVGIVTKNSLVTRDLDLFSRLAQAQACVVYVSLTTLDPELRSVLEPRTAPPAARLATIRTLSHAGIPVGVLVAPVIPGLTDHEVPSLLEAAARAGARYCGYEMLRLPHAVGPLFEEWLERHYPLKKEKVLSFVRAVRKGKLNDFRFGTRMRGEGIFARQVARVFDVARRKAGLCVDGPGLSVKAFRRPGTSQLGLAL